MPHVRKVHDCSNPGAIYCMDIWTFFHIDYKNGIVCMKRPKINVKEAEVGPFKKDPGLFPHLCKKIQFE